MPYVPPHLRGGSAPAPSNDSRAGTAPPSSSQREERGPGSSASYGGFGGSSRREPDRPASQSAASNGFARTGSSKSVTANGSSQPKFKISPWKPSERVAAMTQDQILETRRRLNISIEAEGEDYVSITPIESFVDMVRLIFMLLKLSAGAPVEIFSVFMC